MRLGTEKAQERATQKKNGNNGGERLETDKRPVICFDWDGTLGDSMDLCLGEIRLALERIGHPPVDESLIRACNGPTHEESVGVLGLDPAIGPRFLKERIRAEQELIPALLKLYPGVEDCLKTLAEAADLAIVSNGQADYIRRSVDLFGLTPCFQVIQAAIPGADKTRVLGKVLRDLGGRRYIMVGDRRTDIVAGVENHLQTVAVTYGYGTEEEWELADLRADSVQEMQEMLLRWSKGRLPTGK